MDENYAVEMLPLSYRKDIQTAIDILKEEGCKEVYLFGSLVNGDFTGESDIDLAVKGLKKKFFFKTLGKLIMALDHAVDLINMEKEDRFSAMLKNKGRLLRVA